MSVILEYCILISLAIIPPIALLLIIWSLDKIEKEPKYLVSLLFTLGIFSCIPIAIAEMVLGVFTSDTTPLGAYFEYFFNVAPCEEIGKFLILFLCTWWNKNFNYKYDAIIYSVATSLGFATLENVMYVIQAQITDSSGLLTALVRMMVSIPGHFSFAVIIGFFYGYAKYYHNKKQLGKSTLCILSGLFMAICTHGFFDLCLSLNSIFLIIFIIFVLIVDVITFIIVIHSAKTDMCIDEKPQTAFFNMYRPIYQNNPQGYVNYPNNQFNNIQYPNNSNGHTNNQHSRNNNPNNNNYYH